MSEAPRRINTERSLNRPTEKRPAEAPASKTSLNGQPDFFQPEEPAAPQELPIAKARPEPDTRQELGLKMPAASSGGTGGNSGGNLPPKHAAPQGSGGRPRGPAGLPRTPAQTDTEHAALAAAGGHAGCGGTAVRRGGLRGQHGDQGGR